MECIDGPADGIIASDDDNYCRVGVNVTDLCPGEYNEMKRLCRLRLNNDLTLFLP